VQRVAQARGTPAAASWLTCPAISAEVPPLEKPMMPMRLRSMRLVVPSAFSAASASRLKSGPLTADWCSTVEVTPRGRKESITTAATPIAASARA